MSETSVASGKLTGFAAACLEKLGLAAADARLVAETLVESNLRGVDSHGVVRLPHYAKRLRNGTVNPRPKIFGAAHRRFDRRGGRRPPAWDSSWPSGRCRKRSPWPRQSGVGAVGARNSSHCGACAYFVELAVREGLVGVALTHTDSIMVPPG